MPAIHVRTPIDLVTVLPYHLGFHPSDSLVLVGLRGRELDLVARLDLPSRPLEVDHASSVMLGQLRRDGCTGAVVIVYETEAGRGDRAGEVLARRLRSAGLGVAERMVVRDGRVHFPESPDPAEAAAGVPLPSDAAVPAVAEFVALGRRPSKDRQSLAARVAHQPGPVSDRIAGAAARLDALCLAPDVRRRAIDDWGRMLDPTGGPRPSPASAAAAARMALSLTDRCVRDLLCAWLCPGTVALEVFDPELVVRVRSRWGPPDATPAHDRESPGTGAGAVAGMDVRVGDRSGDGDGPGDGDASAPGDAGGKAARAADAPDHADPAGPVDPTHAADPPPAAGWAPETAGLIVDRLCWLARHVPTDLAPGVLTVLASFTWWLGDGALTRLALERALELAPDYRLALLLERLVDLAIRPQRSA